MARGKKQLSNAFADFSKKQNTEREPVTETINRNNEKESVTEIVKQNIETENENNEQKHTQETQHENVTMLSNTDNLTKDVTLEPKILSVQQVKDELLNMYQEKSKKETVEDTHIRTTFLFRKDLAKRLDKLAKNKRGFKTMFMNKAIEALLDELEKE
jgi:hypothetical protein